MPYWENAVTISSIREQASADLTPSRPVLNGKAAAAFTLGQISGFSQNLLQALPVAIYTTDAEGRVTSFNEAAAALWGRRPELGKSEYCGAYKLYWPDGTSLPHDQCPMAMTLRNRQPIRGMEAVCERPDGTRVALIPYPTPVFDASGKLIGAVNIVVDISERKQAEAASAKRRDELAALYQFADKLCRAQVPNDIFDSALDATTRALGCKRASVLLLDDAGIMRFAAGRGLSDAYRRAVDGHSPWARDSKEPQPLCIEDVEAADLPEGLRATVKAEGIAALAFIPLVVSGKLIGTFMIYYDAPHLFNEAEVELAATIARQLGFGVERMRADQGSRLLAAIVGTSDDAIVSKNLNGIVTSWNRGAERTFGYTPDEMIGRPIMTLIPPDRQSEEVEILERIRRGERVEHYETVRQRKDGSIVDVFLSVSPVKDAAGNVVGASKIARDISERKRAQARQDLLTQEIQHRTRNLFAVVLAVVSRSFVGKDTVEDAKAAVIDRLRSLGKTHVMLIDHEWQGADLSEIVCAEMSPYAGRVRIEGPSLVLTARAAQNFALALHELATNAAKYGALSNMTGRVQISWSKVPSNGSSLFTFRWQEQGGPQISAPTQKGFGSTVLEHVMAEHFGMPPRIDFPITGMNYEISGSLDALMDEHNLQRSAAPSQKQRPRSPSRGRGEGADLGVGVNSL
jgi:PAS domain S-box-containing protein